jgi:hypothetical protein
MPIVAWRAKNVFLFFRAPTANIELFFALKGGSLSFGGFDRPLDLRRLLVVWWFRQAQPPRRALRRLIAAWWFRQAQPPQRVERRQAQRRRGSKTSLTFVMVMATKCGGWA